MIELGGNITLVGFKDLGYAEFVVVKKVVGNYARNFSEMGTMQDLTVTLKPVHNTEEEPSKYEVKGKLDLNGTIYNSEVVEFNLFIGIDSVLKKLKNQLRD